MIRSVSSGLLAFWLLLPMQAAAQEYGALTEGAGVVQELDMGAQSTVIDGVRYSVAADVEVEINGSYGAFTMLEEGMRVYYEFLRISSSERVVTLIRELPDNVELPGV